MHYPLTGYIGRMGSTNSLTAHPGVRCQGTLWGPNHLTGRGGGRYCAEAGEKFHLVHSSKFNLKDNRRQMLGWSPYEAPRRFKAWENDLPPPHLSLQSAEWQDRWGRVIFLYQKPLQSPRKGSTTGEEPPPNALLGSTKKFVGSQRTVLLQMQCSPCSSNLATTEGLSPMPTYLQFFQELLRKGKKQGWETVVPLLQGCPDSGRLATAVEHGCFLLSLCWVRPKVCKEQGLVSCDGIIGRVPTMEKKPEGAGRGYNKLMMGWGRQTISYQ